MSSPYVAIVANGEFPQSKELQNILVNANIIIACDGAIDKLLFYNITPNYIIGDCDSLSITVRTTFADRIVIIDEQNNNDLTKAVNFAAQHNLNHILIFGASGLREDHTLANISLLAKYIDIIPNIVIISDFGIFTAYNASTNYNISTIPKQQISFFTLDFATQVTCPELKWPLVNYQFESLFSGTLNEALGNSITLTSNGKVIVYRAFEIKLK
jgi:thiamine pyrophosphokinase